LIHETFENSLDVHIFQILQILLLLGFKNDLNRVYKISIKRQPYLYLFLFVESVLQKETVSDETKPQTNGCH